MFVSVIIISPQPQTSNQLVPLPCQLGRLKPGTESIHTTQQQTTPPPKHTHTLRTNQHHTPPTNASTSTYLDSQQSLTLQLGSLLLVVLCFTPESWLKYTTLMLKKDQLV